MRHRLLLTVLLLLQLAGVAQLSALQLRNGTVRFLHGTGSFNWQAFADSNTAVHHTYCALAQFAGTPNQLQVKQMVNAGIIPGAYVGEHVFLVSISKPVTAATLQQAGIVSLQSIPPNMKTDARLRGALLPAYAVKKPGTIDVLVSLAPGFTVATVQQHLQQMGMQLTDQSLAQWGILTVRVPQSHFGRLAQQPYVQFIQPVAPAERPLNDEVRNNARANVLQAPLAKGGENLQGAGVAIGIGDDADITSHVDLADRVINRSAFPFQNHGTQVAGTAAGAGNRDALYKGVAPQATLVSQLFAGIIKEAGRYVADHGMVVTNNSYGTIYTDCSYAGVYDLYSRVLDQQAFAYPQLLHVFAAGNDGTLQCAGYPTGYHTVLGGYQSAKNSLCVGWGEKIPMASAAGSKGPVWDGRIKPDLVASGSEVRSTGTGNGYITDWGSSLSAPAAAGGVALLVEKYRQMHSGANPPSALVKALLMNGATDVDQPGPDFGAGFGWLNLNRSLDMMKQQRFVQAVVANNAANTHAVSVPAGVGQLKIMLYWHDPAAVVFANKTLVNDLDLEVVNPANGTVLPWVLDTNRANITLPAIRGVDRLNNVEQVTIDLPAAGNYTIRVKGQAINQGASQAYVVVYDMLPGTIDLTFPAGGEPLVPGETVTVNWDAWDNSTNPFTLQLSTDGSTNYNNISTAIPGAARQYNWVVPNTPTGQAKMRLLRNGTSLVSESATFAIFPLANVTLQATTCEGYFPIQWTGVPAATDYEVLMLRNGQMTPIATTTATSYTASGLSKDSIYWMTVRPRANGNAGRASVAVSRQPNTGTCAGNISNNDLKLDSIVLPVSGRLNTSSAIAGSTVTVRIKNLDDAPVTGFEVKYALNGAPFVTEQVNATIAAQGTYLHTFAGFNFSAAGDYNIVAVVKNNVADAVAANDTFTTVLKQLSNAPLTLPYTETFETAPAFTVQQRATGLPGLNRWDFSATGRSGRVRSFVNTGIARSGSKALTLDLNTFVQSGVLNHLVGTFNLSAYNTATHDIRLDVAWKNHAQFANPNNRIWVRGNDQAAWIVAYNLDSLSQEQPGQWLQTASIEVSDLLAASGQNFTSSFQVRFGVLAVIGMADDTHNGGFSFDDLRLYTAQNDVMVKAITGPARHSCGLGANEKITVEVANKSNQALTNIPVYVRADGGPAVMETIPSIAANATVIYTFNQGVNLSATGTHTLDVWTALTTDTYRENDSLLQHTIVHQPVISSFPYLQNFEGGPGNWYAGGKNSSWQYGTPSSLKINKAASGTRAWKTSLQGTYNDDELSYLYSPCFAIGGLTTPWISFSMAMDIEQCQQYLCDAAWLEYSTDGTAWQKLGVQGGGTNWYNRVGQQVWDSAGFTRWHSTGYPLPVGAASIQFRFVMRSDEALFKEGIALDDIHIYDMTNSVYNGPTLQQPVTQQVSAGAPVDFTANNQLLGMLQSQSTLGSTAMQVYINSGGPGNVRFSAGRYLLDRSFTIKPQNKTPADSTTASLYFTDAEADTLSRATSCPGCVQVKDAYELGIVQYSDADPAKENGTMADNVHGTFGFIPAAKVAMVPYERGYYARFRVKDFSEFWLSNGDTNAGQPLPALLRNFSVERQGANVLVQWQVAGEQNVEAYEVEVAAGNMAYAAGQFVALQRVVSRNTGNGQYNITDNTPGKTGARYYRLKIIDRFGGVRYSEVRVVVYDAQAAWAVYPNPARNMLQVVTQAAAGTLVNIQLVNATGQVLLTRSSVATGFVDKLQVNLRETAIAPGMYVVKVLANGAEKQFKVMVQ